MTNSNQLSTLNLTQVKLHCAKHPVRLGIEVKFIAQGKTRFGEVRSRCCVDGKFLYEIVETSTAKQFLNVEERRVLLQQ